MNENIYIINLDSIFNTLIKCVMAKEEETWL